MKRVALLSLREGPMAIDSAAQLLVATIDALSQRAPAIVAAAAHQLQTIQVGLHFGDGSYGGLRAQHSRLIAQAEAGVNPQVEVYFDPRTMNLLFDLERQPVDEVWEGRYDFRGERADLLAVWRTFRLLSQRSSGLRAVQALWQTYRQQRPDLWGQPAQTTLPQRQNRFSGWHALDYLEQRYPEDTDRDQPLLGDSVYTDARVLWTGYDSTPWWDLIPTEDADLMETLQHCKNRARAEILALIPERDPRALSL